MRGFEGGESGGTPCSRRDQGHIMIVGGGWNIMMGKIKSKARSSVQGI